MTCLHMCRGLWHCVYGYWKLPKWHGTWGLNGEVKSLIIIISPLPISLPSLARPLCALPLSFCTTPPMLSAFLSREFLARFWKDSAFPYLKALACHAWHIVASVCNALYSLPFINAASFLPMQLKNHFLMGRLPSQGSLSQLLSKSSLLLYVFRGLHCIPSERFSQHVTLRLTRSDATMRVEVPWEQGPCLFLRILVFPAPGS